ncbi:MAG: glycosyltransferase family 87 protein [Ignavibacteria bacterium]
MFRRKFGWILVISAGAVITFYGFYLSSNSFSDFAGYYTSTKILLDADSTANLYDDEWFISKMHSFGIPDSTFIMYVNPPPSAFIMIPVAWLQPLPAKIVWNSFNLIFLIIAFYLLLKFNNFSLASLKIQAMAALFFCTVPFLRNLQRGQIYILLLLFIIVFFQGYLRGNALLSSLSMAILFLLKYFGWMFFILFIIEKRWKELGLSLLFISIGFLFTLIIAGIETYEANFNVIIDAFNRKDFSLTGLPCVPAIFGALFTFHPQWNNNPVLNISWFSSLFTAVSLLIMFIFSFIKTRRNTPERLNSILILSVIFTPLAADHHYMLLTLPAAYLMQRDFFDLKNLKILLMFAVLYLLLGWYPELKMNSLAGWAKLLAFPRLYAAVFMWLLLLFPSSLVRATK